MTDVDDSAPPVDGRVARRQRNVDTVLDVVIEMFAEEAMFPTMEQAATRSGLSLRSLYRYFADPGELLEAVIARTSQVGVELSQLRDPGEGPLDKRIDEFSAMRVRVHDEIGSVFRAALANAARHPRVRDQLADDRANMRRQFEQQFAPELAARKGSDRTAVLAAGDLLTQLESVEFLRRHRQLSAAETRAAIRVGLRALLN